MSGYNNSIDDATMVSRGVHDAPRAEPRAVPIPALPFPTLSFLRGRTARRVGPWLLLLTLAVAAFPAATSRAAAGGAATSKRANVGIKPAADGNYTVIDLGASTAGLTVSGATAYAINDYNQVVGDYYDAGGASHAFIWNPTGPSTGVMSDLGVGDGSHAYGINGRGNVVGQGAGGAYIAIPPPPGAVGAYTVTTLVAGGIAYGINNKDAVVGTSGGKAFVRAANPRDPSATGVITTINGSIGSGASDGRAINIGGAIVGNVSGKYAGSADGASRMYLINGRTSRAFALNSSGQAGGYWVPPDVSGNPGVHAILWDPSSAGPYPTYDSTYTDLGNLGGSFATILGINDNGVSVGYGTTDMGQPHAAISRVGASLDDLNNYIDPGSSWTLSHAYAINSDGVIVGDARTQDANGNPTGPMHAVLLLPPGVSLLPPADAPATVTPRASPVGGTGPTSKPELKVTSAPGNFQPSFVQGVPLTVTVTAEVTWNGYLPGFVDFVVDGTLVSEVSVYNGKHTVTSIVTYSFNAGAIGAGPHTLRVVAGSADVNSVRSNVKTFVVCGVAMPGWLQYLLVSGFLSPFKFNGTNTLTATGTKEVTGVKSEDPGLPQAQKEFKDSKVAVTWTWSVIITLANPTSIKLSAQISRSKTFYRNRQGAVGVPAKILGFDLEVKVSLGVSGEILVNTCTVSALNATISVAAEANLIKTYYLLQLLAEAGFGPAAHLFDLVLLASDDVGATFLDALGHAYLKLGFAGSVQGAWTTYDNNNPLYFGFLHYAGTTSSFSPSLEGGFEIANLGYTLKLSLKGSITWAYVNKWPILGGWPDTTTYLVQPAISLKFPNGVLLAKTFPISYVSTLAPTTPIPTIVPSSTPTSAPTGTPGGPTGTPGAATDTPGGSDQTCGPNTAPTGTPTASSAPTWTATPTCGPTTPTTVAATLRNVARPAAASPSAVASLVYVPHVAGPNYAVFHGGSSVRQALAPARQARQRAAAQDAHPLARAATTTTSSVLESNTYTYTVPSLAVDPATGKSLLLWVHDDPNKPAGGSTEIYASRSNGASFDTPISITNDNLPDDAPQVSWTHDGGAVAVWQRETQMPPISPTWDITTANGIQIATSSYSDTANGGAGAWSPVSLLTTNPALHTTPQLVRNGAGNVLAAWRENPSGTLASSAKHPDTIATAFYTNGAWTAPITAVTPISGLDGLAAGYGNDGSAVLAYGQPVRPITITYQGSATPVTPTDGLTPTADVTTTAVVTPSQLFTSAYDPTSGTWSAPQQVTDDDAGVVHPQVVYNGANQPLAVYLSGDGTALYLRNLSTGDVISRTMTTEIGYITNVQALRDSAGNVAVVLTGQQGANTALYVARFDAAHRLWGNPMPLTSPSGDSIDAPTAGIDRGGRLLAAYASTALSAQPITTTTDAGQVVTSPSTFSTEGQTDLVTLSHAFTSSLTMTDTDLALSNPYPGPGATVGVSATVHNTGDLPLDGVAVDFYDGDPQAGGALVGTATAPDTLTPGDAITLTVPYTVPASGVARTLYAVASASDPAATANGGGHVARLVAFGPDLQLVTQGASAAGPNTTMVNTFIGNAGTTTSPTSTLTLAQDGVPGSPVYTATVPPIDPGQTITLTTPYTYGAPAAGTYTVTATVNRGGQDFAEADLSDNSDVAKFTVAPDLAVVQDSLVARPLADGREAVVGTVVNNSNVPVGSTNMQLYVDTPFSDTTLAATTTVPALAPGGTAMVTTIWDNPTAGHHTFYDAVNMDMSSMVTETNESNNVASVEADVAQAAATATPSPAGTARPPLAFSMSTAGIDFGGQLPGTTSAPQQVTVTNTGSRTLTVAVVAQTTDKSGDPYQSFSLDGCGQQPDQLGIGTTFDLAAGQSCTLDATFHPTADGPLSLTYQLSVYLGSKTDGPPQNLVLSGTGGVTNLTGTATATGPSASPTSNGTTTTGTAAPSATATSPALPPDTSMATATPSPTSTSTPTATNTSTATPTPTNTSTPTPTSTSTATPRAPDSATPIPTSTATPTGTRAASVAPTSTTPAGAAATTTAAASGLSLPRPTYTPQPTYTALPDGVDVGPGAAPPPIVIVVTRVAAHSTTTPATSHGTTGRTGSKRKTPGKKPVAHPALRTLAAPTLSVRPGVIVSGSNITVSESGLGRLARTDVIVSLLGQVPLQPVHPGLRPHVRAASGTHPPQRTPQKARAAPTKPVRKPAVRTRTVVLYQTTVHRQADKLGRLKTTIHLGYAPRVATRATLVVTVQTKQARGMRSIAVTVVPRPAHQPTNKKKTTRTAPVPRATAGKDTIR